MRLFRRSFIAAVIVGAFTCAAPPVVKPLAAQQSEAKKKIKKAGKEAKDAGKKAGDAAADAGTAAGDEAKAGASKVTEIARDTAPKGVTAQCDDGTWTKTTKLTGACVTHGGVASVVCPGALCQQ
jgi:hypothetical protein